MGKLEGKVAIVTGAGSGIGRAVALRYAEEGARVVLSDINEQGGRESLEALKAGGAEAVFVQVDASKPADHEALVKAAVETYGGLHVACNNAGIGGPQAPTGDYPVEGWDRVIATNLSGVFYGMRVQIPAMVASGGGSIVNIASILGQVAFRTVCGYTAAKHGVIGLTRAAAIEYANQGVRVNAVGPAFIRTPMIAEIDENFLAPLHPIGRIGEVTEVTGIVLLLSSDDASFMTGGYYPVDGGYLAQ
jgi:NAD(P)-dependent dehydrogenase (short-subunit alcohol dehydrogenase family)